MRRSLAALMGAVILATLGGCGGGGGNAPQSSKPAEPDATASISGPGVTLTAAVNPEIPVLPGDILPAIEDDSQRMAKARKQIDTLNKAVLLYIEKNKAAPPSLEALAQPVVDENGKILQPGYIDPSLLGDPWGASLVFDARGIRNGNKQPDIWSLGPPSGKVFIGNWSDQPTPAAPLPEK